MKLNNKPKVASKQQSEDTYLKRQNKPEPGCQGFWKKFLFHSKASETPLDLSE